MQGYARLVLDRRLLIVTGKGGTGRSAVTSAIARYRAARGERVLALAIDSGVGLAVHLRLGALEPAPVRVEAGLAAAIVDPASALDEYMRRRSRSAPIGLSSRVFRVLAYTVPGVRDIVLVGKVVYEATRGSWDCVVVDAPPAGQVQSTFEAPRTIADLVPNGLVHDQAVEVAATLSDGAVSELVIVTTPEELALTEAAAVREAADRAGVTPTTTRIANRVLPDPGFDSAPIEPGPRRDAALLHLQVMSSQRGLLAESPCEVEFPLLFGPRRPGDTSIKLASLLEVE